MNIKKYLAKKLIKPVLKLHSFHYHMAARLAILLDDNGIHPKHRIMRYKEWFLEQIDKNWIILDVGCNTGMMPYLFSEKAKFVYGIEIAENLIREAKRKRQNDNIEYICADATLFDFKDIKIDCVTLSNVLEHIENREEFLHKLVQNILWNNNDDKRLLIRVPMINREWIVLYKKELGIDYRLDSTHFTEYTLEQLEDELSGANIQIISHEIKFGEIYAVCKSC